MPLQPRGEFRFVPVNAPVVDGEAAPRSLSPGAAAGGRRNCGRSRAPAATTWPADLAADPPRGSGGAGRPGDTGGNQRCNRRAHLNPPPAQRQSTRVHDPSKQSAARLLAPEALIADRAWLRNLTRRLAGDVDGAADLEQDVALAALAADRRDGGAGSGDRANRSWFATVACNLAALARRRARRTAQRLQHLHRREQASSPAELVATAEQQQRAVAAVLALPAAYRDTILARFLEGLTVEQAARHLGVPVETVRTRQQRALRQLRAQLLPDDRRRSLLPSLLSFSVVMNKNLLVAAALPLLLALLAAPLWWNGAVAAPPPVAEQPAVAVAAPAELVEPAAPPPPPTPVARESIDTAPAVAAAVAAVAAAPKPMGSIEVVVTFADDVPAAERGVWCRGPFGAVRQQVTGADGRARFEHLAAGDYTVGASDSKRNQATVLDGAPSRVDLRIAEGLRIRGRVVGPDDQPAPFAELVAKSASISPSFLHTLGRADRNGRFEFRGLEPHEMVGARDARLGSSPCELLRKETADREMVLRLVGDLPATLRGLVTDTAGVPLADAWIEVFQPRLLERGDDGVTRMWLPSSTTHSATDGAFEVGWLRPGRATLRVCRRGFAPQARPVEIEAGSAQPQLVRLTAGATFRGTVRDGAGRAAVGAVIRCAQLVPPQPGHQIVGADAAFAFTDLPPGKLTFAVSYKNSSQEVHEVQVNGTEALVWDAVISAERQLRGRLLDHTGAPLANWMIDRPSSSRYAVTGADGRFILPDCDTETVSLLVRQRVGTGPVVMRFDDVAIRGGEAMLMLPADRASVLRATGQCLATDGAPLVGASLQLFQDQMQVGGPKLTGEDGAFELSSLPPGGYRLEVRHASCRFEPVQFTLTPGVPCELGVLRAVRR